jgi:hypothetical protein
MRGSNHAATNTTGNPAAAGAGADQPESATGTAETIAASGSNGPSSAATLIAAPRAPEILLAW